LGQAVDHLLLSIDHLQCILPLTGLVLAD